ncbi:pyridoxamine 5'-phosphate oxidase family protein [Jiangella mangrovi]|uniref:Pyridoxamine 5'-phosphate oxidase n=1 Tax=Jiangella mangrovi TaxID=1524084 RepID=A0A7W9LMI4_9ACTN|nr:pyridoxamine 5'-phosphate oxidase family protein [Jiangella mangrovi]MBB5789266.1 pyridoxamine 5'-phosphate oxidase [Jiangella mangrovi]
MMANDGAALNGVSGHPLRLLAGWVDEAGGGSSARCFTFTTASADGTPHARTVLATAIDESGVRFHTSRPSMKTADVAANPRAAGVFFWPALVRQVTLHGTAAVLTPSLAEARAWYGAQAPNLRALAWTHDELGDVEGAAVEPARVRAVFERFLADDPPQPPPSWTPIVLVPDRVDVWWMPEGSGIATRARFTLDDGGDWTRRYVLP